MHCCLVVVSPDRPFMGHEKGIWLLESASLKMLLNARERMENRKMEHYSSGSDVPRRGVANSLSSHVNQPLPLRAICCSECETPPLLTLHSSKEKRCITRE